MISPEVFHRLRAAQSRSAYEQRLLSGRDWLLVAFFVQLLAALHPLFAWINHTRLGAGLHEGLHPGINFAATLALAAALASLWLWARYAPFRATVAAVIVFVAVHGALGFADPGVLLSGAVVKSLVLLGLLQAANTGYLRHRPL
jgi:hypothetical protein